MLVWGVCLCGVCACVGCVLVWGVPLCGVCPCVGCALVCGVSQNLASLVNLLPTSWCCSGDRVLSVNGQRVWHHRQASELIRSGTVVVSLLVEKADRDRLPDLSEGLAGGGGGLKHIGQWGCTSSALGEAGHSVQCSSHFAGELETSMDGAELSGWLATSMMEDTIPEEADEGGDEVAPQPLRYTLSATTPPESHPIPWEGATQTVVVDWSPEASPPVQEIEGVAEREEGEENGSSEQAQQDKAEEEGVDSSPVESTVTITRHPQKNTFGIKFEVSGYCLLASLVSWHLLSW